MNRLLIHIGPHKTGSTAVQKYLWEKQDLLVENGILYGGAEWVGKYGHSVAADKRYIKDLLDYIVGLRDIQHTERLSSLLLTSENFCRWEERDITRLLSIFNSVEIIYVYRDPLSTLYSHWQEFVKFGGTKTQSDYTFSHLHNASSSVIMNPTIVIDRWLASCPSCVLHIINYDHIVQVGKNIVNEFLSIIVDKKISLQEKNEKVNKSFKLERTELLRVLNSLARHSGIEPSNRLRKAFLERKNDERVGKIEDFIRSQIYSLSLKLPNDYKALNERFCQQFRKYFKDAPTPSNTPHVLFSVNSDWTLFENDVRGDLLALYAQCARDAFQN